MTTPNSDTTTPKDDTSRWVTVKEAARILDKSQRTIRRWIAKDDIPVDRTRDVIHVDIAGRLDDTPGTDMTTPGPPPGTPEALPGDDVTPPGAELEALEARIAELEGEISRLRSARDEAEAKVDRLQGENRELRATKDMLQELLNEVRQQRDYLERMNAAQLSKIPDRGPSIWRRLLPWIGREDVG